MNMKNEYDYKGFSERLLSALKEANLDRLTQAEMSYKLGVTQQNYGYYLRGQRIPRLEIAEKLAELTGCDLGWLLTGKRPNGYATLEDAWAAASPAAKERLLKKLLSASSVAA